MRWLWILFGFMTLVVLVFLTRDVINYIIYESKQKKLLWFRKYSWKLVKRHVLNVNRHEEVVRKLDPKLVAMLDGFINSDAAKVIYLNRGYPMLSDMMVLMIDNYYSSQN